MRQMMGVVRCKITKSFFKDRIVEELFNVVSLVLWTVGEKCPIWIFNLLPYSKQFCCTMSFRKGIEDLMLDFRDQFKGYDDRVQRLHEPSPWHVHCVLGFQGSWGKMSDNLSLEKSMYTIVEAPGKMGFWGHL